MHQRGSDTVTDDVKHTRLKTYHLILLASSIIGNEGMAVFGQIYALLTLQYLGVPTSLATANGVVGGGTATFLIPLCGLLMDKGHNPKIRKLVALGLSGLLSVGAFCVLFGAALIKINEVGTITASSMNQTEKVVAYIKSNCSLNNSFTMEMQTSFNGCINMYPPAIQNDPPADGAPWIPLTGILGLTAFSMLDTAFDLGNSFSRAFSLDHTPHVQHKVILMMISILAPAAGAVVSIFGIVDFPEILGTTFDVDGTAATLVFFAIFLIILVIISNVCNISTGVWIAKNRGYLLQGNVSSSEESSDIMIAYSSDTSPCLESDDTKRHQEGAYIATSGFHSSSSFGNENQSFIMDDENTNMHKMTDSKPLLDDIKQSKYGSYSKYSKRNDYIKIGENNVPSPQLQVENSGNRSLHSDEIIKKPTFFTKRLIILILATYASMFCMVHFSNFGANALTIGVFHGDPLALPGTRENTLYVKGLRRSALGSTIFYVSYFLTSILNKNMIKLVGEKVLFVTSHVLHAAMTGIFVYAQRLEFYYISMATFGLFRWALYTIPYMMANEFTDKSMGPTNVGSGKQNFSKAGRVVSVISILCPINYLTSSASMGPLLAITGNVWLPLIFSSCAGFVSVLIFIPLFFMKSE